MRVAVRIPDIVTSGFDDGPKRVSAEQVMVGCATDHASAGEIHRLNCVC
jgi:hypothetical protein